MRDRAAGFCIFNDVAIACSILRDQFSRIAYIDIDVHHGDGVQAIFYDDPTVLTCSIHESGRTLFPGSGFIKETGAERSALNVPLLAKTPGDIWLDAFRRTVIPAVKNFDPGAIVLQLGTDPHYRDPLGHLQVRQQEWLAAVQAVHALGLPIVAAGGGGYEMTTVPRMWVSAILTLAGEEVPSMVPEELQEELGVTTFTDEVS
jgi:acetoin utilization protein AcuC